jgi:hypothetical protein
MSKFIAHSLQIKDPVRYIEAVRSAMPNLNSEVTLALFPTRLFFAAWVFKRLLIGPSSSIRLLMYRQSIIFKSRRLNHRTITVCHFISDYNATASRFLEYGWSAARPYRCAWRARRRRPHSHATSERSTTQARLPRRRWWLTSKLTEHRWKCRLKP